MQKLNFTTFIKAPRQKVWDTMLEDKTYRQWTEPFMPGSYYEGNWRQGSKINFLAQEPDGTLSGMMSEIKESRPPEFVSIRHLGEIVKNKKKPWPRGKEILENYTLTEKGGGTELKIELDSVDEYKEMFEDMWPKALAELKRIAEQAN